MSPSRHVLALAKRNVCSNAEGGRPVAVTVATQGFGGVGR